MLMRTIIKKCDKMTEEAYYEPNQVKASVKAGVGGFVEGFCDGALMMYFPLLITCVYAGYKLRNK